MRSVIAAVVLAASASGAFAQDGNWSQWRGPAYNGMAPNATPPLTWSESKNVVWKVPIPGRGSATPIVWGDRMFLLTAIKTDKQVERAAEPEPEQRGNRRRRRRNRPPTHVYQFAVLCIDRNSGEEIWRTVVNEECPHEGMHSTSTYASLSPVTDGTHVWASFGSRGTYCLTMDGKVVWKRDLGDMTTRNHFGEGASPALHGDALVHPWDHEGDSFIVCLDAKTGEDRWRVSRDERTTWVTPLIVEHGGVTQVITNGKNRAIAYDLKNGEVVWQCGGQDANAIPTPVVKGDVVYLMSGFRQYKIQAIPLSARGDITGTDKVLWEYDEAAPYVASPLLYDDKLYFTKQRNPQISCVTTDGEKLWGPKRLGGIQMVYASPLGAVGRVYFVGRNGTTYVLKHGAAFEVLAKNQLDDDGFDSSPVAIGDRLYLRGAKYLYCLAEQGAKTGAAPAPKRDKVASGLATWPRFRGPDGSGTSTDTRIPVQWSDEKNLAWKTEMPGKGFSSPIVFGDRVYVTCYSNEQDLDHVKRHLVCVDRSNGKIVWSKTVDATAPEREERRMAAHGYASHTPVTDGERIYAMFGATGVIAFDMSGEELWRRDVGREQASRFGSSSSPILHGDLVIVTAGNESRAMYAFDKKTGEPRWRTKSVRPFASCYSTPSIFKNAAGEDELLVSVTDEVWSLDPKDGKLKWYAETRVDSAACTNLLAKDGICYVVGGRQGGRTALKIGGKDDVTKKNVLWSTRGGSYVPSAVLHEGRLYWVNDSGNVFCVDAKTGEQVARKRVRDRFYASVVLIDGKLYAFSRFGGCYVFEATPELKQLAHNKLADKSDFSASPAVVDGQLIFRSDACLYCVSKG